MERTLDAVGWAILRELQADARLSMAELGRRVGMSAPAISERVRRLEDADVITGYRAEVSLPSVGRPVLAFLRISAAGDVKARVAEVVRGVPEVLEAHRGTGSDCFIVKLAVRDIADLERVTDRFSEFGQTTTSIVLSTLLHGRPTELADDREAPG